MKKYENIVIGFGKGGKTLAGALASAGQSTAVIERSPLMYGGTCINVACIPSKSLEASARMSEAIGGSFGDRAARYSAAIAEKRRLTAMLRGKNYDKAVSAGVDVIDGAASFTGPHSLMVKTPGGEKINLEAERIFINTGSRPFMPSIEGLGSCRFVYTSETLMELDSLPEKLIIIGGGYIGLEFASYYANFGSQVTVIQDGSEFMPREDEDIAKAVLASFNKRGIEFVSGARVTRVADDGGAARVEYSSGGAEHTVPAGAVLVAAGRRPELTGLAPEAAGVELTPRGAVKTDEKLRTTAPGIWAMGDVAGGLQFTYISLDDSRIVLSQLLGGMERTTLDRGAVPYSVFTDPPVSRVGLTQREAKEQGYDAVCAKLPAAAVPKAQVLRRTDGLLKAVVERKTGLILGAHFFCAQSQEMINTVKLAMDAKLPYTALASGIFTHPTMSEAMNDLFSSVKL
jgi:pyruvate/2-oxoglutarate dehydrogenase complex dihydrolipoamide dehydrogenase (E3) component